MTTTTLNELATRLPGRVVLGEPLAKYTTYRIGGPAAALVSPRSTEEVALALSFCRETGTPWLPIGLGSNILVSDAGFDGVVVRLGKGMDAVREEGHVWHVGAGLPTPRLSRRTAQAGLAGVHRLIGVPGTVGGGVSMNGGAHGQDFSQVVTGIELVRSDGTVHDVRGDSIAWRYRGSGLEGNVVTAATVELEPGDVGDLKRDVIRHFKWRKDGTPFDSPCCGSVFRNPGTPDTASSSGHEEDRPRTAGQLVDAAGLAGFRIGDAQVSPKHANYIVNLGGATAADVRAVIDTVRERVLEQFGVELQLEVKIIGP